MTSPTNTPQHLRHEFTAGLAGKGLPIWRDLMNGYGRTCRAHSTISRGADGC